MATKTREPRLNYEHLIVESVTFYVADTPMVRSTGVYVFDMHPRKVTVEKRDVGVKMIVEGRTNYGPRTAKFNLCGYPLYDPPPTWLLELWAEVRERRSIRE